MISHQRKFIFVHIPKTGGTRIEKALRDDTCSACRDQWDVAKVAHAPLNHLTLDEISEHGFATQEEFDSYFKFSFVRNPWDRAISEFMFPPLRELFGQCSSFREGLEVMAQWVDVGYGNHLRRQVDFVAAKEARLDFIGYFENLREDFRSVGRYIGIDRVDLTHENWLDHRPYWEYYDAWTRDMVADLYAADIKTFGYSFL